MRLSAGRCEELLRRSDHGVLSTLHPDRGVDAVPACFVVAGTELGVPVDRVKQKATSDLQRTRNLRQDPRAALLCERWDRSDWSQLWWVRASLAFASDEPPGGSDFESLLRHKYPQYVGKEFDGVLVFHITGLAGWAASAESAPLSGGAGPDGRIGRLESPGV